jgi:replicative DNA helicase
METVMVNENRKPLSTGFGNLDTLLAGGFYPSELTVIEASPSIGKSAFALTIATHLAIRENVPVAFFSLEMSRQQVLGRITSSESGIESAKIRTEVLSPDELRKIQAMTDRISSAPLYIADEACIKLNDLKTQVRQLRNQYKVEIVFVDYLTLVGSEDTHKPRHEQIADIMRALKQLAVEMNIAVIVLSLMSSKAEEECPSIPTLPDAGTSIGEIADLVIVLSRNKASRLGDPVKADVMVSRNIRDTTGSVSLFFRPQFGRFEEIPKPLLRKKIGCVA